MVDTLHIYILTCPCTCTFTNLVYNSKSTIDPKHVDHAIVYRSAKNNHGPAEVVGLHVHVYGGNV